MSTVMQRPEQQRPRSKSTFSLKSHKSHGSHSTAKQEQHALHLRQSSKEEKPHFGTSTKADPNAAMNEVQPTAAALEKPTLQSLRSFAHIDPATGQPIAEPDLSNPTRSRWERPLDTIRSFEAAIDGEYKRRSHVMRMDAPSEATGLASRRSSYYGGGYEQSRSQQQGGGYYGSRQAAAPRESWADNGYGAGQGPRARNNRMQTEPNWNRQNNAQNVYPTPGYQQSRDTVNTGGSGGSHSDPYATDPSSDNSSIEQAQQRGGPVRQPQPPADLGEQYGFNGFGGGPQPILEEYGNGRGSADNNGYFPEQHRASGNPPAAPMKLGNAPQPPAHNPNVIKLSQSNSQGQGPPPAAGRPGLLSRKNTEKGDKRQSWFKKRFSKKE